MKKNLIKVSNPSAAEKLKSLGFSYIKEQINKIDIYVFTTSSELLEVLNKNYNKSDFFFDNKLHF